MASNNNKGDSDGHNMDNVMHHGYNHNHGMDDYVLIHGGQDEGQQNLPENQGHGGTQQVLGMDSLGMHHQHHQPHQHHQQHHQQQQQQQQHLQSSMYVGDMSSAAAGIQQQVHAAQQHQHHNQHFMPSGLVHQMQHDVNAAIYAHQQIVGSSLISDQHLAMAAARGDPPCPDTEPVPRLARKSGNSRQKKYKENMSDEKREKYRAADRSRKAAARSKLTDELKNKYREECRMRQSTLRSQTDDEKKEAIRQANRVRQRDLRRSLTDEARVQYLAAGRASQQLARSRLDEDKKAVIREANKLRQRALRLRKANARTAEVAGTAGDSIDVVGGDGTTYIGMDPAGTVPGRGVPVPPVPSLAEGLQQHILLQSAHLPQDGASEASGAAAGAAANGVDVIGYPSGGPGVGVGMLSGGSASGSGHSHDVSQLTPGQLQAIANMNMGVGGSGAVGLMDAIPQHMDIYSAGVGGMQQQQEGQGQGQSEQQTDNGSM